MATADRKKQMAFEHRYKQRRLQEGFIQTRVWLPEELKDWHHDMVLRARAAKERGIKFSVPRPPAIEPISDK